MCTLKGNLSDLRSIIQQRPGIRDLSPSIAPASTGLLCRPVVDLEESGHQLGRQRQIRIVVGAQTDKAWSGVVTRDTQGGFQILQLVDVMAMAAEALRDGVVRPRPHAGKPKVSPQRYDEVPGPGTRACISSQYLVDIRELQEMLLGRNGPPAKFCR